MEIRPSILHPFMHDDATVIISLASPLPALGEIGEIGENRENRENRENGENACSLIASEETRLEGQFFNAELNMARTSLR